MSEQVHVVSLSPRQQAAIRLMLFNMYTSYLQKCKEDLEDNIYDSNLNSIIESRFRKMLDNFSKYDAFTDVFCSKDGARKADSNMITISVDGMRTLQQAMRGFDKNNCFLSPGEVQYIVSEYDKLFKLLDKSAQFTYTQEEIKRGGK